MIGLHRLSLALPLLFGGVRGIDIDVSNVDSIKAAAKTLAGGIMAAYDQYQGPGGVPGLWESNESDNGYFWWNYGMAWNAIIEYSHLTGDHQYDELIRAGLVHQIGDLDAFMPANQTKTLGNDDQGTWALAALTSAEFGLEDPKDIELLQLAKNVFDVQVQRWNEESCAGGLKWQIFTFNNGYNYRNTMSNGIFFLLAARLAQATKNETYSEWAEKSFDWAQQVGLVSEDYAVYDGTDDRTNCSEINHLQWSANHGIYTDASAIMFNLTGDDQWKTRVEGFLKSSHVFVEENVLQEVGCEKNEMCNTDQRMFKGIAARSYARTAISAPFAADQLRKTLEESAKSAAKACDGEGLELECAFGWVGEDDLTQEVGKTGLPEAFSALEAVQGLLYLSSNVSLVDPEGPAGSPSGNATVSPTGTPTGSPVPGQGDSAAHKMTITWAGVLLSVALAAFSL